MADYRINDVLLYVSKTVESALNTQEATGANFLKALTTQPTYILPQIEFTNDAGKPGNGHEFANSQCVTYVTHPRITFTDDVNTSYAGRLALRSLGGSVTTAQQAATAAYKHSCVMLDSTTSRQLPSTTVISKLGTDASFLLAGMVVESYSLSQTRAERPQFSCELVGSGKFVKPHGVTSLPSTVDTLTCLDGNNTVISWTDTGGAQTLTGSGCAVRNWNAGIQNATRLNDRCPGDSTVTILDAGTSLTKSPAYTGKMRHGDRIGSAQITVTQDSDVNNWLTYATDDVLTDVTFSTRGAIIASTYRYTVSIIFPKARITSLETGNDDGDATYTMGLTAFWDSSTSTAAKIEVINTETSAFV
jgi:hypothetical protein